MHTNVAETRRDWKDGVDDRNILLIEYSMKDEERLMGWIDTREVHTDTSKTRGVD